MRGALIAVEGIDGSGKGTQSALLVEKLRDEGFEAELISFPCYGETFFGREVGNYLNGEYGGLNDVNPKFSAMLYAGDRFEKRSYILEKMAAGVIVVCDRYVPSNIAHQAAKCDGSDRVSLVRWIEKLEYEVYGLPQPDEVVFLNTLPNFADDLVSRKSAREYTDKEKDLHESDKEYLSSVYSVFCAMSKDQGWLEVLSVENGFLRSIESISEEIVLNTKKRVMKCLV